MCSSFRFCVSIVVDSTRVFYSFVSETPGNFTLEDGGRTAVAMQEKGVSEKDTGPRRKVLTAKFLFIAPWFYVSL